MDYMTSSYETSVTSSFSSKSDETAENENLTLHFPSALLSCSLCILLCLLFTCTVLIIIVSIS